MQRIVTNCSLDCFDCCSLEAQVEGNKILKLIGNKNHPFTKGMICSKGRKHLDRTYHEKRILNPKLKVDGEFKDISYEEAFNLLVDKLKSIKEQYGSKSVIHYYDSGYTGLSKTVDKMFFNYYGGAAKHSGTLCWGAGLKAQEIDFGDNISSSPKHLVLSNAIIVWGRNPADTNIHMLSYLIQGKKKGARLILIDPIKTNTAKYCDEYISINPSTDGALALGMAKYIIDNNMMDDGFIKENIHGYQPFVESLNEYNLDYVSKVTGISKESIISLCEIISKDKCAFIIGYGMQRYKQGGNATRCINALAAITGNIGKAGNGVYYSNKTVSRYISGEVDLSTNNVKQRRSYSKTHLADFILKAKDPEIKMLFITRSNPVLQIPNINKTISAFKQVEFKVVMDHFMTDTAEQADLVLPATTTLEEEDFFSSSMLSPYLNYSERVIEPRNNIIGEYDFFMELAKRMGMEDYPYISRQEFFKRELKPLIDTFGISYEELKAKPFIIPDEDIAYEDLIFATPSNKIELYSNKAKDMRISPIPTFIESKVGDEYSLRLITPHHKDSIHSQHMMDNDGLPEVFINERCRETKGFSDGDVVIVQSKHGKIRCTLRIGDRVKVGTIFIYQGWWIKNGGVNKLTDDSISDMGEQAAYYDCYCKLVNIDDN